MTIEQIKMFITAAECLNFTEAANREFVSQPTLSYSISSLENQLHLKLFVRDKKGVALTKAGEVFYEHVRDHVGGIEDAIKAAQESVKKPVASLSVGYLISPAEKHFPEWIPAFVDKYPDARLVIEQYEMTDLKNALFNNVVDIVLSRSLDYVDCREYVEICPVNKEQLFCAVGGGHRLYGRENISIKELEGETIILPDAERSKSWYNFALNFCRSHGIEFAPEKIKTVKSASAIHPLVSCNMGIALSSGSWKQKHGGSIDFLPFSDAEINYDSALVWRKNNKNPLIEWFVEAAMKTVK